MSPTEPVLQACPTCGTMLDIRDEEPFAQVHCPVCNTATRVRRRFNNYVLEEILGAGGMGTVYKALDENLNRYVALKLLRKEYSSDEEYVEKFDMEAKITASITHPHVVKVFSFGSDGGLFYIAMELVDKGSLDDLINLQERVAEIQVLEVGIQVSQGLQAAHQRGLIHRDVKPGNILFSDAQTSKVVDFGLALLMEKEAEARGEVWGTPYYVAPEKLNNEPEDFRSDIYSLGGTLFHAIAGRPPFEAENASLVALKHLKAQVVSLQAFAPDVSNATAYVINRMLHKDPNQRYQSYEDLIEHLIYAKTQLQESMTKPRDTKTRLIIESEEQQSAMSWMIMGLLALILIVGAAFFFLRKSGDEEPTPVPPVVEHQTTAQQPLIAATPEPEIKDAVDKPAKRGGGKSKPAKPAKAKKTRGITEEHTDSYRKALADILNGNYAEAKTKLNKVEGEMDEIPFKSWIYLQLGVIYLLEENENSARAEFTKASQYVEGFEAKQDSDVEKLQFFKDMAAWIESGKAVPAADVLKYNVDDYRNYAVLVMGIRNFNKGVYPEAKILFEKFLSSPFLNAEGAWVGDFKTIASNYLKKIQEKTATAP